MSKSVGRITDKSYHQEYKIDKGERTYYYRICPICQEVLDMGFSELDGGNAVAVLPHVCRELKEFAEMVGTARLPKIRYEWGQFYTTMPKITNKFKVTVDA